MGIYLPNMEMPKSCRECPLATRFFDGEDVCAMLGTYVHDRDREDNCPLVPVPPHGRLGDLDALPWYLANTSVKYATYEDWEKLCDAITAAPTVIPASEEGE